MRHGNKINHLGRKFAHRKAMLSNMASSLIVHKRITTTVAKAKELRKFVEPLITRAKTNTTHSRRMVFSYLQDKISVSALFGEVAGRIGERQGGYTRIIRLGDVRLGDSAEMCMMELVDFNDLYTKEGTTAKTAKTRRSRGKGKVETVAEDVTPVAESGSEEAPEKKSEAKKAPKKGKDAE